MWDFWFSELRNSYSPGKRCRIKYVFSKMQINKPHVRALSPAKINLFLKVTGKRPDGYHNLHTLMCGITLFDNLLFEFDESNIRVCCSHPEVPENNSNLVWRAADIFLRNMDRICGIKITIEKKIPVGAGLGGGSSNAATVLKVLNKYFGLKFSDDKLRDISLEIGADVPFFIYGRPAVATGIGEKIEPYHGLTPSPVVLIFPGFGVSTEMVYNNLTLGLTNCAETITCTCLNQQGFNAERHLYNDLESVTVSKYPAILSVKEVLLQHGAKGALMSGSGPTVFGIFSEPGLAQDAAKIISENQKWQVFLAELLV
jgi:4-diphosphocytidyl-2-C-methyl-D-erythritol kinase